MIDRVLLFNQALRRGPNTPLLAVMCAVVVALPAYAAGPYLATGIKVGEVTHNEATIWVRLTRDESRIPDGAPMPIVRYYNPETDALETRRGRRDRQPLVTFPQGTTIDTLEGAAPGIEGFFKIVYYLAGGNGGGSTNWKHVHRDADFTHQFTLTDLQPGKQYHFQIFTRHNLINPLAGQKLEGRFKTAPLPDTPAPITFTVSTGQAYPDRDDPIRGFKIYDTMLDLDPDFFVHTGDIVYYDTYAKTLPLARWHWDRTYSLPGNIDFHRQIASYFIKDDHDTWMNDCWPSQQTKFMGAFTFAQGLRLFPQEVPMGPRTYRTFRWGKDLQIWLVEGRDFRSPNTLPDGPEKTIWGAEQMAWFKSTVTESDATFRVLISPTPVVGPDRTRKSDNHANAAFTHEGNLLRDFIAAQKNMIVVCGDRHWQYVSVDARTGVKEFSCGPASNEHAGGWSNDQRHPEHQYLNVTGGFLALTVDRPNNTPTLTARHYSVDGKILNEDTTTATP